VLLIYHKKNLPPSKSVLS